MSGTKEDPQLLEEDDDFEEFPKEGRFCKRKNAVYYLIAWVWVSVSGELRVGHIQFAEWIA